MSSCPACPRCVPHDAENCPLEKDRTEKKGPAVPMPAGKKTGWHLNFDVGPHVIYDQRQKPVGTLHAQPKEHVSRNSGNDMTSVKGSGLKLNKLPSPLLTNPSPNQETS